MAIKENALPLGQSSGSGTYIRTVSSGGESQRTTFDIVKGAITADMDDAIEAEAEARESADTQLETELNSKVDKVTGKGLSTNDFTNALKTKLDGIEAGAEVNTIETVKVNGTALVPDANKAVNVPAPTVDSALSDSSTNPVQNKVITGAVNDLKEDISYFVTNTNAVFESGRWDVNTVNRVISASATSKTKTKVDVIPKCTYCITFCSYGTSLPNIIFADKYNNSLLAINGESTRTNLEKYVVAPDNAAYMYVNHDIYSQSAVTPQIDLIAVTSYTNAVELKADELIQYLGASIKILNAVNAQANYIAQITSSGTIQAQTGTTKKMYIYPVTQGNIYILSGTGVYLDTERPIAVFSTSLFNGTDSITADEFLIADTSNVATNYNLTFAPNEDGYIYIATYGSYPQVFVYNANYESSLIKSIENDLATTNDLIDTHNSLLSHNDTFSPDDLFYKYESAFIDDFTTRDSFVDVNHEYVASGDTTNPPAIVTGVGATRTGASGMSGLYYSRAITKLPFCAIIGKVPSAQQNIRVYGTELFTISGTQGSLSYSGSVVGRLHVNAKYYIVFVAQDRVVVMDDVGVSITLPIVYEYGKPLTFEIGYGTNEGRLFGYSSYVEMYPKTLVSLDFDRCVKENEAGEVYALLKSLTSFTHSTNSGSTATYVPTSPNHVVSQSGISNRLCYASVIDWTSDTGYRSETKIVSVTTNLTNKNSGLQRFHFDADLCMNSEDNPSGDYYTYVFQLHDAGFALTGWVDAPPLAIRVKNGKLYAMVNYIDDGAVPASDNRHTTDEYELCNFAQDEWHHIDIDARIGWKTGLLPKLTIKVDGVERLNIDTPIGFNIVSSGGYVVVQFGAYCPEWKSGTYSNTHREVLYTNINWSGEIEQFV